VTEVGPRLGIAPTCAALGMPRATYYRRRRSQSTPPRRRPSPRALSDAERMAVLAVLHEPRFVDLAPAEVYATLLDEGQYLCSQRTMYRVLAAHHEVRERRDQLRHPLYTAPELLARRPNELWSWDITKLVGPVKWTYFYLYVMLDVFSRYVVGWMVRGSASIMKATCRGVAGPRSSIGARAVASRGAICTCGAWSSGGLSTIKGHSARHAPACGGLLKAGTWGSSIVRFGLAWGCRPRIGFRFRVIPGTLGRSRIRG
jgi:integrase-like protein